MKAIMGFTQIAAAAGTVAAHHTHLLAAPPMLHSLASAAYAPMGPADASFLALAACAGGCDVPSLRARAGAVSSLSVELPDPCAQWSDFEGCLEPALIQAAGRRAGAAGRSSALRGGDPTMPQPPSAGVPAGALAPTPDLGTPRDSVSAMAALVTDGSLGATGDPSATRRSLFDRLLHTVSVGAADPAASSLAAEPWNGGSGLARASLDALRRRAIDANDTSVARLPPAALKALAASARRAEDGTDDVVVALNMTLVRSALERAEALLRAGRTTVSASELGLEPPPQALLGAAQRFASVAERSGSGVGRAERAAAEALAGSAIASAKARLGAGPAALGGGRASLSTDAAELGSAALSEGKSAEDKARAEAMEASVAAASFPGTARAGPGNAIRQAAKSMPPGAATLGGNAQAGVAPGLGQPGTAALTKVLGGLQALSKLGKLANVGPPDPLLAILLKLLLLPFSVVRMIPIPMPYSFISLLLYPLIPPFFGLPGPPSPPGGVPPTLEAIVGARPFDASSTAGSAQLGPCTCFCPVTDTGFAPLPPLYGHAMVTVDGGRSALMVGGGCMDTDEQGYSGDVGVTGDAWVLRLGVGNSSAVSRRMGDDLARRARPLLNVMQTNDTLAHALELEELINTYDRRFWLQPPRRRRIAHTGHVWWQVGNTRPKEPAWRQRPYGNGGLRMPPRMGHTAVGFDRRLGDGSVEPLHGFLARMSAVAHKLKGATDPGQEAFDAREALFPRWKGDKRQWAAEPGVKRAVASAVMRESGVRELWQEDMSALRAVAAKAAADKEEADKNAAAKKKGDGAEEASLLQKGGKEWGDGDEQLASEEWDPQPRVGGPPSGMEVPVGIKDGWPGYRGNSSDALFDAVLVFGGYSGGAVFGDLWALMRFTDDASRACATPGSDGITCAMSQPESAGVEQRWINGGDVARAMRRRIIRTKGEDDAKTAIKVFNSNANMQFGRAGGADRRPVHVRDDEPIKWSWEWRDLSGAVGGEAPGPRHHHAAARVADEFMVIVGGEAGTEAVPGKPADPEDLARAKAPRMSGAAGAGAGPAPAAKQARPGLQPLATRFLGDVHVFHVPTLSWVAVDVAGESLPPRARHAVATAGSAVFVFGGVAAGGGPLGDLWRVQLPCRRPSPAVPRPGSAAYSPPLAKLPVTRTGVLCSAAPGSAPAAFAMPSSVSVERVAASGALPTARFGHTMLLLNQRLVILGGFGAGTGGGDWRTRMSTGGLRMDAALLDAGLPSVTAVRPSVLSPSGVDPLTGRSSTRVMLFGRGFGSCPAWGWAWAGGTNRCVAGCKGWKTRQGWAANSAEGGRAGVKRADGTPAMAALSKARAEAPDGSAACAEDDVDSWAGNNPAAPSVAAGSQPCERVVWFSPFAMSCVIAGPLADPALAAAETAPLYVTLPDGRHNHDAADAAVRESLSAALSPEQSTGFFFESETASLAELDPAPLREQAWGSAPAPGDGLASVLGLGADDGEPKASAGAFLQMGAGAMLGHAAAGRRRALASSLLGSLVAAARRARAHAEDVVGVSREQAAHHAASLRADAAWVRAGLGRHGNGTAASALLQSRGTAVAEALEARASTAHAAALEAAATASRLAAAAPASEHDARGGSPVALGSRVLAPVLRVGPPLLASVYPDRLIDAPGRGPVFLVGRGFGVYEAHHSNAAAGAAPKPGGVVFDLHGSEPPLVAVWFGDRPCLRLVVVSDSVALCACFARGPESDATGYSRPAFRVGRGMDTPPEPPAPPGEPSLVQMSGYQYVRGASKRELAGLTRSETIPYGRAFAEARAPSSAWPIDPTVAAEAAAPWGRAVLYRRGRPSNLGSFTLLAPEQKPPSPALVMDTTYGQGKTTLSIHLLGEAIKAAFASVGAAFRKAFGMGGGSGGGGGSPLDSLNKKRRKANRKARKDAKRIANPPKPGPFRPLEAYDPTLAYKVEEVFMDKASAGSAKPEQTVFLAKGEAKLNTVVRSCPAQGDVDRAAEAALTLAAEAEAAISLGLASHTPLGRALGGIAPPSEEASRQRSTLVLRGDLTITKHKRGLPALAKKAPSLLQAAAGGRSKRPAERAATWVMSEGEGCAGGAAAAAAPDRQRCHALRCEVRVPDLEARFATHLAGRPGTIVSEACGCGDVLRKGLDTSGMKGGAGGSDAVTITGKDVSRGCRRSLAAYGWGLGCLDLARSFADVCGVPEQGADPAAGAGATEVVNALVVAAAGTGFRPTAAASAGGSAARFSSAGASSTLSRTRAVLASALRSVKPGVGTAGYDMADDASGPLGRGINGEGEALPRDARMTRDAEAGADALYDAELRAARGDASGGREGAGSTGASVGALAAERGRPAEGLAAEVREALRDATAAGLEQQGLLGRALEAASAYGATAGGFDGSAMLQRGSTRRRRQAGARHGAGGVLAAGDDGAAAAAGLLQAGARAGRPGDGDEEDAADAVPRPGVAPTSVEEVLGPALRSQCLSLRALLASRCATLPHLAAALPDLLAVARVRRAGADAAASRGLLGSAGSFDDTAELFPSAVGRGAASQTSDAPPAPGAVAAAVHALAELMRTSNGTVRASDVEARAAGPRFAAAGAESRHLARAAAEAAVQLAMADAGVSGDASRVTIGSVAAPQDPRPAAGPRRRAPQPPLDTPDLPDPGSSPSAAFARPDAVCFRGAPPLPRVGFGAVALGDAKTLIVYGGLAEEGGQPLRSNVIAGLPRLKQAPRNDTMMLTQMSPAEMASASFSRFACSAEASEGLRAARVLPDDA